MTRYRALVEVNAPVDADEEQRIIAARDSGSPLPREERKMQRFAVGEEITFLPEQSVPWLLEQGCIEEIAEEPRRRRGAQNDEV